MRGQNESYHNWEAKEREDRPGIPISLQGAFKTPMA
jgi:hypothetical protein